MNRLREKTMAIMLIAIFMISICANLPTFAADEGDIEESIEKGLAWLAEIQYDDGSWPGDEPVAKTGLAVIKFIDRAKELDMSPFSEEYEYSTTVYLGLEYIFLNAHKMDISAPQPHGDPDSDGDDWGVYFVEYDYHHSYTTGICLMAVGAADTCADKLGLPSPVVAVGPLAGWTYEQVIQDTVDYLAYGQNDAGWERGGWGYVHNEVGWSENSNTGWVTLGLGYALASGATIPQFVYGELEVWINYIQNTGQPDWNDPDPYGGSGYAAPDDWVNMLKTGNLLYQMALVGYPIDDPRVKDAINYQERHWNYADWDPGWKGPGWAADWAHHQATFCIMKGFEAYGIDLIDLDDDGIPEFDWFDDISTRIVQTQHPDGWWAHDYWGDGFFSTIWAILTLEKVVEVPRILVYVDIKPGSWPNPINKGSKGVFSTAICGTEELDVMTIEPETVKIYIEGIMKGVPQLRWSYEDVATPYTGEPGDGHELEDDGFIDLVLHFDTQKVVEALELCKYDDETIPLIIRGNLFEEHGGTTIEGQDYVWLKAPKGKDKPEPQPPPTCGHPLEGMTIQIGMTSATTGGMENTVALADEIIEPKINEYVSALGLNITFEFLVEDNEGNWETALEKIQYFKSIGVDLVIGHAWSSQCQGSLDYVNENDMLLLSQSSTAPVLAIPDDRLFRTCPTDVVQGIALAEMWKTWGVKAVLTMHREDLWAEGLWEIFEVKLNEGGIVNLGNINYAFNETEFSSYLDYANDTITEAIEDYGGAQYVGMQFFSFAEFENITKQADDYTNLLDIIWMGTEDNGRNQAMLDEVGEWAVQTRQFSPSMTIDSDSFLFQEFEELYYDLTGNFVGFYTATQYDAAWLMVETILKTASIDPSVIAESLIPTSYRMQGITGWMALDENGDRMPQLFDIWGFYKDSETDEYLFHKFGSYDGRTMKVDWDDEALEYYAGITRPGE